MSWQILHVVDLWHRTGTISWEPLRCSWLTGHMLLNPVMGFFAKRKLNYATNVAWISTYRVSTHCCTRSSVQSVMESQVVRKLCRWDRKKQNPPATYQINRGFLYYIQFIYKCHMWLAVVELLGKYIFCLYICSLVHFSGHFTVLSLEGVISRPGGRQTMYYLLIPPYLVHLPLWTRGKEWLAQSFPGRSVSSIEIYHWNGKFPWDVTENAVHSIYSTSLWDHQTLNICDCRNMLAWHLLLPLSILLFFFYFCHLLLFHHFWVFGV